MSYSLSNNLESGEEEVKFATSLEEISEVFSKEVLEIAIESILSKKINVTIEYAEICDSDERNFTKINLFDQLDNDKNMRYFKELSGELKDKFESSSIENDSSNLDFGNYIFDDVELQIPNKSGEEVVNSLIKLI